MAPRLSRRQIERRRKFGQDVFEFRQQARQLPPLISQGCAQAVRIGCAIDEVFQDFHERQIGDGFVMLRAMPDQQRHPLGVSRGRNLIRQPSLADAGFAGNQEQPPAARSRIVESAQQGSQLAPASHHRTRQPSSNLFGSSYLRCANLCDKSIAPGRHGSHESRRVGIVAQGSPHLPDRSIDAVFAIDEDALAPDALENFLARDDLPAAVNEQEQQFQRNSLKLHHSAAASELMGAPVKLKVVELNYFVGHF